MLGSVKLCKPFGLDRLYCAAPILHRQRFFYEVKKLDLIKDAVYINTPTKKHHVFVGTRKCTNNPRVSIWYLMREIGKKEISRFTYEDVNRVFEFVEVPDDVKKEIDRKKNMIAETDKKVANLFAAFGLRS